MPCHMSSFRECDKKAECKEMPTRIKIVVSLSQRVGAVWQSSEGLCEEDA